jgi:hypothetical protein
MLIGVGAGMHEDRVARLDARPPASGGVAGAAVIVLPPAGSPGVLFHNHTILTGTNAAASAITVD